MQKNILQYFFKRDGSPMDIVPFNEIIEFEWYPYHKSKSKNIIVPNNVNEIWLYDNNPYIINYFIESDSMSMISLDETIYNPIKTLNDYEKIIHNQNGWKRLWPKVEKDNMEKKFDSIYEEVFEMPLEGQFIVFWTYNDKIWADSYKWINNNIFRYCNNMDDFKIQIDTPNPIEFELKNNPIYFILKNKEKDEIL